MDTYIDDFDPAFEKLLSDNRDRYVLQSSRTRCGQVAPLPERKQSDATAYTPKASAWFFRDRPVLQPLVASRSA